MLAQAEEKHVYDELVKGELTAYLRDWPAPFDVIVSADTLVYFGALEDVAAAAAGALRPGGRLIFTVEEAIGAGDRRAVTRLEPHGRYSHTRQYVERRAGGGESRAGDRRSGAAARGRRCRSPGWWCARRNRRVQAMRPCLA